jgi:16S rRNA processing protein RimM
MSEARLTVGYIAGMHGVAGGVRVRLFDADSDAIEPGREIELWRDEACVQRAHVVSAAIVPGKAPVLRVQLREVTDRNAAERLKGCEVRVQRDALPPLADDEFYLDDLIGAHVVENAGDATRLLGTVTGVSSNGVQDLLEVEWTAPDGSRQPWLLPVLPQFLVEVETSRVVVELPVGFVPDALEALR